MKEDILSQWCNQNILPKKKRKLRFSVKVNIYLKPCICLKFENVSIENEDVAAKKIEFLKSWMQNELISPYEI